MELDKEAKRVNNMKVKIKLINLKTLETFEKEFKSEFQRDKFRQKLKYSKKIKEVRYVDNPSYF